jgi:hypothetical protein
MTSAPYLCPTMHAERLEDERVWSLVKFVVTRSQWRWTLFVEPLSARIAGADLAPRLSWLADHGHEIAMHIHFRPLLGEPGATTGYTKTGPVSDESAIRCLDEGYAYLHERGYEPVGFLSGAWRLFDTAFSWLQANGFRYDSSLRTYAPAGPDIRAVPNEACPNVRMVGSLVEVPTTATLKQQVRAELRRARPVSSREVPYDLFYLHDYDLLDVRRRLSLRVLASRMRTRQSLTVAELLTHLEPEPERNELDKPQAE